MKVYLLYSNPYDEGYDVYGIFSTPRKALTAKKLFSGKSNYELRIMCLEMDELEQHFKRATLNQRLYLLHRTRYDFLKEVNYGKWSVSPCGLDSFLDYKEDRQDYIVEFRHYMSGTVLAESEENAIEIAEKMISEGRVLLYQERESS